MPHTQPQPSGRRHPRRTSTFTYRLLVELEETDVWRRIEVASDTPLDRLHGILQVALGWTDSHLHEFVLGDVQSELDVERFLTPADLDEGEVGVLEGEVHLDELLAAPGDEAFYTYDFGDGWRHVLRLEAVRERDADEAEARCLDGARACPPEDSGGPCGYAELLELALLATVGSLAEEDAERLAWMSRGSTPAEVLTDADAFDAAEVDARLERWFASGETSPGIGLEVPDGPLAALVDRAAWPAAVDLVTLVASAVHEGAPDVRVDVAAGAMSPFAWFADYARKGLTLTSAGYLKPVDVEAVAERLQIADEWIGTLNREVHTPPVLEFRELARALGLVRVARGRLITTAAGRRLESDPVALWWHVASRTPGSRSTVAHDAGILVLLAVAASGGGEITDASGGVDLAALMAAIGWQRRDGLPLEERNVLSDASATVGLLRRIGGFQREGRYFWTWEPTPTGIDFARSALTVWG